MTSRKFNTDKFKELYKDKSLSVTDIAKMMDLSKYTLYRYIKEENITRDCEYSFTKEEYIKFYIEENHNVSEVMEKFNLSKYAVNKYNKEYGIIKGNDSIRKTRSKTFKERYNSDSPMKIDIFKDKYRKTLMENYNVDNPMKNSSIKGKYKDSIKSKYGVDNISKDPNIRNQIESTNILKYGNKSYPSSIEGRIKLMNSRSTVRSKRLSRESMMFNKDKINEANYFNENTIDYINEYIKVNDEKPTYKDLSVSTGLHVSTVNYIINKFNLKDMISNKKVSYMEDEVISFIKEINPEIIIERNVRSLISPYEIDIYLPEYKIGIECNPTTTHNSSKGAFNTDSKPRGYHKLKTDMCENLDIFLFHIYGYEWTHNRTSIKFMLRNLIDKNDIKIYGRNTEVRLASSKVATAFLSENHRQGPVGSSIKLGLYIKGTDELVSLMCFNDKKNNNYELVRFCSKVNTNVVGGASKLFKYFIKIYDPKEVISFADRSHARGKLYSNLNFRMDKILPPNYKWVYLKNDTYLSRNACYKGKLSRLFEDVTKDDIKNKTEREIMIEHGYVQVYDSGMLRYVWNKD